MRYKIQKLDTESSLDLARILSKINVNEKFTFDADMNWVSPFGMLIASCSIRNFRSKYSDKPFIIEYDVDNEAFSYASHMGFFKSISDKVSIGRAPGEATGNNKYIPITELDLSRNENHESDNSQKSHIGNIIENKSSVLAKILSRGNSEFQSLLTYLICEMLRNIPEHAECHKAWICGQSWDNGKAEIAILDEGIGILGSLRGNITHRKYIYNDEVALENALKAGISQAFSPSKKNSSTDPWANSGFGLFMVSEICKELKGSFCIASGSKYLHIRENGTYHIGDTYFKGTAIKINIPLVSLSDSDELIKRISKIGELQAKNTRRAFKNASKSSISLTKNFDKK